MSAPELSPEEQRIVARFDAAPNAPEAWDQKLWDAIATLVPCHPEGDCEYSDECECTANDVRDLMYRLAMAERYRQQADPYDPEVDRVCCSMLVSNPFYRGTTAPADAALAVFRGQQDPAVRRVLALAEQAEDRIRQSTPPLTADRLIAEGTAPTVTTGELRAAIGGDGRPAEESPHEHAWSEWVEGPSGSYRFCLDTSCSDGEIR